MKLTKQKKEAMKFYDAYWDSYLKGDIESMADLLDDDYTQIGSAETEVFFNKKDAVKFLHDTIDQVAGKLEMRNRSIRLEKQSNFLLFHELCDLYALAGPGWIFYSKFRATTIMEEKKHCWKIIHQHSSFPDARTGEGENIAIDKIAEENRELREAVKRRTIELEQKNRELEIETALEKVRSSALAMKEPGDMVEVCRIISDQLQTLGVKDIRNVQTAIINEQKSTYLNYQYFTAYNKSTIEEAEYNKHPKAREMAETMKKSVEAFFSQSFDGEELSVFREYRKQDDQFPDPILDEAASLHFYFYSIGPGALGISTYNTPLSENDMHLLKRFRNVFELAYRRFIDIELAIAQAKEAKIEAALERVRSRTMGMQKSEELKEVIRVVYEQFVHLKINVDHAGFVVDYKLKGAWHFWIADEQDIPSKITHPYFESVWANQFNEAKEKGADFFATNLNFEEKNKFYNELLSHVPGLPEASKDFYLSCPGLAGSTVLLENVGLYIENFSGIPYSDEENNTLMRFGKVFQQTYTRFLDLQKAEAQAREAQIEASLERVRSSAMAMHNSNDISSTTTAVFEELGKLNIKSKRCGIALLSRNSYMGHVYAAATSSDGKFLTLRRSIDMTQHQSLQQQYESWKKQENYFIEMNDEELKSYYQLPFFYSSPDYVPPANYERTEYGYYIPFSEGLFYAWTENPYTEDEIDILKRFERIVDLTFRRYLDLKKAEAQTREAIKQASLDRVRGEIASMRTAEDLNRITPIIWRELKTLDVPFIRCGVFIVDEDKEKVRVYLTTPDGKSLGVLNLSFNANELTETTVEHWRKKNIYKEHWNKEQFIKWTMSMIKQRQVQNAETYQGSAVPPESLDLHFVPFTQGMLYVGDTSPLNDEKLQLVKTLAEAFSIAYARYEDFQRLEAAKVEVESAFGELDVLSKELKTKNEELENENRRKALELEEARQLQLAMLPKSIPEIPHLDIAVYMKTATEVGGDYYDFNVDPDGTLTVAIGDATGHGMKAGTIVSMIKALFASTGLRSDLKTYFHQSSDALKGIELGRLMMAFMMLRINSNKLELSNAGMPPLFIYRKQSKEVEEIMIAGMPLGAMKDFPYEIRETEISTGDTLLLLSDGLPELKNEKDVQYGYTRVKDEFKSAADKSPNEIVEHLKDSASEWMNGIEPDDDVTFVVIKVKSY